MPPWSALCVCVCVCVCSLLRYRLNVFLPPLPEIQRSNFFRFSESLGKSNRKKLSKIFKLSLVKGVKLTQQKKNYGFFCIWSLQFQGIFAPTSLSPMSKLFRFLESLGKSNGKKLSQIWQLLLIRGVELPQILLLLLFFFIFYGKFLYRCYYSHRLRDASSPVCRIFVVVEELYNK